MSKKQNILIREEIGSSFNFFSFGKQLYKTIQESLAECDKTGDRKNTLLTFLLTFFVVLALAIRRDLNQDAVIDWMLSKLRWLRCRLPKQIVTEGALTRARQRLGAKVFRIVFHKFVAKTELSPDFHGRSSVAFDGTTGDMPDTDGNLETFGKPSNQIGGTGYPQMRMVALLSLSLRKILDVAYNAYQGKGTGERNLMKQLLTRFKDKSLLFILDAGLYSFELIEYFKDCQQEYIIKLALHVKLKRTSDFRFSDGSYLATISKKFKEFDPKSNKTRLVTRKIVIRVIPFQIPGFRAARLITNILDLAITAKEIAIHYHQRWDIEIAFDEIKTHQCATLRGKLPTIFRSKTPKLVIQELYAMLIVYNYVRDLIGEAATTYGKNPLFLSFLGTLQLLIDFIPHISLENCYKGYVKSFDYLLSLIAETEIDRPKRHRINPRVVKVKASKFPRKNESHKSESRNFEQDLHILQNTA